MKKIQRIVDIRFVERAAALLRYVCAALAVVYVISTVLALAGRQSFTLHMDGEMYEGAFLAEKDPATAAEEPFTVSLGDTVYVWADGDGRIGLAARMGLAIMFAVTVLPAAAGQWVLSLMFREISEGSLFTEQNAGYLMTFGLLEMFVAAVAPLIKLLTAWAVTLVPGNRMEVMIGRGVTGLVSALAVIVAAYILGCGVELQDEADHTL